MKIRQSQDFVQGLAEMNEDRLIDREQRTESRKQETDREQAKNRQVRTKKQYFSYFL